MSHAGLAPAVLELDAVAKNFGGFQAVRDLSFRVDEGEIFGFLGPNGAGKTTTLRMMLDIIQPSAGAISILGAPSAGPVRRRVGYLPEERGLYRKMKAVDTIAYFAQLRGLSGKEAKARAYSLLEEFDLGDFARSKNEALSKGMAQKVQLLSTIAHDPDLLILDEPFSGLDPINQATLETLIRRLRDQGKTILFSTHVMEHAERLCDRFLILAQGEKRFDGTLAQAREAFPPHLVVRTPVAKERLVSLPGVYGVEDHETTSSEGEYTVNMQEGVDPQEILRAAVEAGIPLTRFDLMPASLHEIFVALAGDAAAPGRAAPPKGPSPEREAAA